MVDTIKFKRGANADLPATLQAGEPAFTTDTGDLYVGNGATKVHINAVKTKADIGLGNVDNTSDLNKPISTATQTALNGKQDTLPAGTASQFLRGSDKTFVAVTKSDVGLGSVDNLQQMPLSYLDTSTSLGTSNTKVPSQNAVKAYVDAAIAGDITIDGGTF